VAASPKFVETAEEESNTVEDDDRLQVIVALPLLPDPVEPLVPPTPETELLVQFAPPPPPPPSPSRLPPPPPPPPE
jgi:hypothetical protein